ncbi:MAG TPA: hypothetical protein VGF76_04850, partial [Polyangiaceae bacterium]
GALGANRVQVQVLNRHDDCCFGASRTEYNDRGTGLSFDDAVRSFEIDVRTVLEQIGSGSFRLEIDEAAPAHMISWNTIGSIVLPELHGSVRGEPMPGVETFARSARGTLVHEIAGQTEDTGIAVVGVPAWKSSSNGDYDVFARNPSNRFIHASKRGSAWTSASLGTVIMTDPALVGSSSARLDATAVTTDYLPHHWWSDGAAWSTEVVSNAPKALGSPNLAEHVAGQLDLFLRDWTHAPIALRSDGSDGWTALPPKSSGTP